MNDLALPFKNGDISNVLSNAIRRSFKGTFFPFPFLSQAKYKDVSKEVLLEYEIATITLLKRLEETSRLIASMKNKRPDAKHQLELLKELKESI